MTNRKPTTADELKADIESHPDRGTIDGVDVVRFDQDEIRGKIPKELHRELLIWAGLNGKTKAQAIEYAITFMLNDEGHQALVERRLREKAELFKTSPTEIRNAILGYFKRIARQSRAKLTGVELDEPTDDRLDAAIGQVLVVDSMPIETKNLGLKDDGRSTKRERKEP